MSKGRKRIAFILIGFLFVVGSLVWMKYNATDINPIPAITFSIGLIAILGTVKRVFLDLSKRQNTNES